jgi:eukaryotic-like serine/threonine-protein kinase
MTTSPDRWDAVGRLYHAALARPVDERAAFLAEACADDEELRREVQSLLTQASAGGGLTGGAVAAAAGLVTDVGHSVLAGRRLGAYQILAPLGAGGMGEVYRARDTRLGRDVAIKILPRAFTADASRLARFEREARVLASLNHPHIAAIYGFEEGPAEAGPIKALILELVEGETLAERIARAGGPKGPPLRHGNAERNFSDGRSGGPSGPPMPIKEALDIARQIADALDAAHEKGIVHRDLKPANIKITPQGVVKVLDFGLAKLDAGPAGAAGEAGGDVVSEAPTITVDDTREGLIVGTAAYMSPEQARGHAVDKRTDVWAFGCVLYEMLAGHAAFSGATLSDTIAALIDRTPDWSLLPTATPSTVRRLLERSLRKDQRERLRDIGDVRTELTDALQALAAAGTRVTKATRIAAAASVVAILVAAVGYLVYGRLSGSNATISSTIRATFNQLTSSPGVEWFPSISPDGKWVVFAGDTSGNRDIFLQSTTGQNPINLTADSSDDDDQPAFSPDGERIAFRSERDGGGIFVMGRTGEAPRRVTRTGYHPTWSPDGSRLAYTTRTVDLNPQNSVGESEVWTVDVRSGATSRLGELQNAMDVSWSPHGNRLAVSIQASGTRQADIVTVDVGRGETVPLLTDPAMEWSPVWSPDGRALYFTSDRSGSMNLWRVAVDEDSGRALGNPEPLTTPSSFASHVSIAADGRHVVYSSVRITSNVARLRFNPNAGTVEGEPSDVTTGSRAWANPDPSPDGQWLTFYSRQNPEGHVYIARSDGTGLRQLTGDTFQDRVPRWSPDGQWITFFSNRSGIRLVLWKIRPDGSELTQAITTGAIYAAWSPDGRRIAASEVPSATRPPATFVVDPSVPLTEQKPETLPPFRTFVVNSWSPNGEMLAGQTTLSATGIAIYSFRNRTYDVLTDFGEFPVWLPDSRQLLFASRGKEIILIDRLTKARRTVYADPRNVIGPPQLTRDGRALYFSRRVTESDIWTVTLN